MPVTSEMRPDIGPSLSAFFFLSILLPIFFLFCFSLSKEEEEEEEEEVEEEEEGEEVFEVGSFCRIDLKKKEEAKKKGKEEEGKAEVEEVREEDGGKGGATPSAPISIITPSHFHSI